jgi:hypothetical protein
MGWDFIFGTSRFTGRVPQDAEIAGQQSHFTLKQIDATCLFDNYLIQLLDRPLHVGK